MTSPRTAALLATAILGLTAAQAHAHGPQIQIALENGKPVTRALFPDGPYDLAATPNQRVYAIPLAQRALGDANDGWYAQPAAAYPFTGPGIATAIGGFGAGSILNLTFADGLKRWDGATFTDPGAEQVDVYRGANRTAGMISSDAGPFAGFAFTAITNTGDEHKTAYLRLLGDGISPNTASDDGVYLASLKLGTDQPGIASSDPYFFVLSKNASPADQAAALAFVNANLVPEPGAIALIGLASLGFARRNRPAIAARFPRPDGNRTFPPT